MFHVSQLKRHMGPTIVSQPPPNCLNEEVELVVQPEQVLDYRYSTQGDLELLTKLTGLPACECPPELYSNLQRLFPQLHLEGKESLDGWGNDRIKVYVRKKRMARAANSTKAFKTGVKGLQETYGKLQENEHATENYSQKGGSTNLQQPQGTIRIFMGELAAQEWRDHCQRQEGISGLEREREGQAEN